MDFFARFDHLVCRNHCKRKILCRVYHEMQGKTTCIVTRFNHSQSVIGGQCWCSLFIWIFFSCQIVSNWPWVWHFLSCWEILEFIICIYIICSLQQRLPWWQEMGAARFLCSTSVNYIDVTFSKTKQLIKNIKINTLKTLLNMQLCQS